MDWLQISFQIEKSQADFISEVLTGLGSLSITYTDTLDDAIYEPPVGQTPLWDNVTVNALFSANVNQEDIKATIFEICNVNALTSFILKDRVWEDECKKDFHSMKFGENLWVCPSWESQAEIPSDAIIINMDPGLAFGTGAHPTTHLCAEWLINNVTRNSEVMDYGCGSGILAIAAYKLGAKKVLGVDIDPQALTASRENSKVNKCSINWLNTDENFKFQADLIVANILSSALMVLAPLLASYCKPTGKIALSGILESQEEKIKEIYSPWFTFEDTLKNDGWICLSGIKKIL